MLGRKGTWTIPQLLLKIESEKMVFYRHTIRARLTLSSGYAYAVFDILNDKKLNLADEELADFFNNVDNEFILPASGYVQTDHAIIYTIYIRQGVKKIMLTSGDVIDFTGQSIILDTVTTVHLPLSD